MTRAFLHYSLSYEVVIYFYMFSSLMEHIIIGNIDRNLIIIVHGRRTLLTPIPISFIRFLIYINSHEMWAITRYFTSVLKHIIAFCFLFLQVIMFPLIKVQYLVVDFLSTCELAQSVYSNLQCPTFGLSYKRFPFSIVPFRYLKIQQ